MRLVPVRIGVLVAVVASGVVGLSASRAEASGSSVPPSFALTSGGGASSSGPIVMSDVNGDGAVDLVAGSSGVQVVLGHGDGTFAPAVAYTTDASPNSVEVADFNGDGNPDIVTASFGSSNLSVLFGNGDGTFASFVAVSTGHAAREMTVGDVNEDGNPDVAVAYADIGNAGGVSLLLGNGDGTFASPSDAYTLVGGAFGVKLADVDGDTHLDFVISVTTSGSDQVVVLRGDGTGAFTQQTQFAAGVVQAVGDLDGDGDSDVVAIDNVQSNYVAVRLRNADGSFASAVRYQTQCCGTVRGAAIGDLNADSIPDLAITGADTSLQFRLGNGDGTFGPPSPPTSIGGVGVDVAIGNLNGDTRPDLAITGSFVRVLINTVGIRMGAPVATAGSDGVTVTWTAPTTPSDAATVTGYTVAAHSPEFQSGQTWTYGAATTSAHIPNLINGDTYTFTVTARNAVGLGPTSSVSNAVTQAIALSPPTIGSATPNGHGGITVSWTAPTVDGGYPVTGYTVTPYTGYFPLLPIEFNSTTTTQTITGLADGQSFRFRVQAVNAAGVSAYSRVTNSVTYTAVVPDMPTNVTAVAGSGQATVSWTTPFDGGSPIIEYFVTPYIGYFPLQTSTCLSPCVITGLDHGTSYRFRVQADNEIGTGPYSKVSNVITTT